MSMTLGRASLSTSPSSQTLQGKTLTIIVDVVGTDIYHFTALRQQLSGLVDNKDEPIVRYTNSEDATLDGFYQVTSVNIPSVTNMLNTYWVPDCTITMEQVTGFSNAWFELSARTLLRTNVHGITNPATIPIATCGSATEIDWGTSTSFSSYGTLTVDDGTGAANGTVALVNSTMSSYTTYASTYGVTSRFSSVASAAYIGAATIEVLYGSTWYKVIGRNIPRSSVWRISNGYVRLTSANGATSGKIETWDSTNKVWVGQNVKHSSSGSVNGDIGIGAGSSTVSVAVLRNRPERVSVRASGFVNGTGGDTWAVTYSLNRGSAFIEFAWTSTAVNKFGIKFTSATAMTLSTQVLYQSSLFSSLAYLIFTCPVAFTSDAVNGSIYNAATSNSGEFAVGVSQAAVSAANAKATVDPWYGYTSWRQRVVIR